jgi:tRNA A-37 threonylcarbamoyl transferase component Bud32
MSTEGEARTKANGRVGEVLKDKWRIDALIGVGGMASVYAATHRNKNRVAVKMLHRQFSGNEAIRTRFLREGYLANTVEHAGAVKVLDDDVAEDGSAFLVMELLDGETIEARWSRKGQRLEPGEVLAIGDKLLDVLAAAHDKGIVHRDIKPENLFLTREGVLKVLDFGIARIFEGSRDKKGTQAGYIMGTPAFMAPEQALARWDEVDGRTDVWAAGATMFTLLSGRHVHEAQTGNEQLIRSATTPPRSLAELDANLPKPVVELIDRALHFEKTKRWPDARAMRDALRKAYQVMRGARGAPMVRVSRSDVRAHRDAPNLGGSSPAEVDPSSVAAELAARLAERDARADELASVMPAVTELNERLTAARRKVASIQQRVLDAKNERAALADQFRRQSMPKSQGVGEARIRLREAMVRFADVAAADTATFGQAFEDARIDVAKHARAFSARERDVTIYEMALRVHDPEGVKTGFFVMAIAGAIVVALFFVPFAVRAVIDASPPPSHPAAPAPS